jgi:hypothetical protein
MAKKLSTSRYDRAAAELAHLGLTAGCYSLKEDKLGTITINALIDGAVRKCTVWNFNDKVEGQILEDLGGFIGAWPPKVKPQRTRRRA